MSKHIVPHDESNTRLHKMYMQLQCAHNKLNIIIIIIIVVHIHTIHNINTYHVIYILYIRTYTHIYLICICALCI